MCEKRIKKSKTTARKTAPTFLTLQKIAIPKNKNS